MKNFGIHVFWVFVLLILSILTTQNILDHKKEIEKLKNVPPKKEYVQNTPALKELYDYYRGLKV